MALVLAAIVFGGAIEFMRVGQQSVVKTSDHAQARMEAMRIHDVIREDLDRVVVDDDIMNLAVPVKLKDGGKRMEFYALHHRRYSKSQGNIVLVARKISYWSEPLPGGGSFYVMRNDKRVLAGSVSPPGPVAKLLFEPLSKKDACELQISPYHAVWAKIHPRGAWDTRNQRLSDANVQSRLLHMSHIESQYACMLTIKNSGPPPGVFTNLDQLDDPFSTYDCPQKTIPASIPLDWVRPLGLVKYDNSAPFDDATADIDEELP